MSDHDHPYSIAMSMQYMAIELEIGNDQRYGTFDIRGIKGTFPTQAITSTNLNQRKSALQSSKLSPETKAAFKKLDFGTKIVERIEFDPHRLVNSPDYRKSMIKNASKMIGDHPGYLFLFTLQGIKSHRGGIGPFQFTRNNNRILIDFQLECGFDLIRVFFNSGQNVDDHAYYRKLVPDKRFLACLDENMVNRYFKTVYRDCLEKGDEMISFFGRKPSSKTSKHNMFNFTFLRSQKYDKMIRVVSSIQKSTDGLVNSLLYKWYEMDVISFMTNKGDPHYRGFVPKALDMWKYNPLLQNTKLRCVITNQNLFDATKEFGSIENSVGGAYDRFYNGSTVPISVHDIVRLNQQLSTLHEQYTQKQLRKILGDRI